MLRELLPHFFAMIMVTGFFLYLWKKHKKHIQHYYNIDDKIIVPSEDSNVVSEYERFVSWIQGAATPSELACLEDQVREWEQAHRSHEWMNDLFIDLMEEIQQRFCVLSVKEIQEKKNA